MGKEESTPVEVDRLNQSLTELLGQITKMTESQLLQTASCAQQLTRFAFLLRGACASELRTRATTRLPGGRGKRDTSGAGIKAHMKELAQKVGVRAKTLETDARVYDTFFKDHLALETGDARAPRCSREIYVIALTAPNPQAALRVALENLKDPTYGRRQFRNYVCTLRRGRKLAASEATKHTARKRVELTEEAERALIELQQLSGLNPPAIITKALSSHLQRLKTSHAKRQGSGLRKVDPLFHSSDEANDSPPETVSKRRNTPDNKGAVKLKQPTLFGAGFSG